MEYVSYDVHFKLTEACRIIKLNASSDVTFDILHKNKKNNLVGFTIHVDEKDEDKAKLLASQKANALCSLFTVKYGKFTALCGENEVGVGGGYVMTGIPGGIEAFDNIPIATGRTSGVEGWQVEAFIIVDGSLQATAQCMSLELGIKGSTVESTSTRSQEIGNDLGIKTSKDLDILNQPVP